MKTANWFATLALLAIGGHSSATELLGGVSTGMTEAEIRELVPAVVDTDIRRPVLPGAIKSLALKGSEFLGHKFTTEFNLADAGLVQVVLVNETLSKKREIRRACTAIRESLVDRYGDPTTSRVTKSMLGNSDHSIYELDDLVVRLTCESPFFPLRLSFQSREWMDQQSPFGLSMGMTIEELLPYLDEPIPEEFSSDEAGEPGTALVLDARLSHVPNMPQGDGNLGFRIRASKGNGLCSIHASMSIVEDKGMEYLFAMASLMPNRDLLGTPTEVGGMFGAYKFSFIPKPVSSVLSEMWLTTAEDKLPGSIDKMVYRSGSGRLDGVKMHIESVEIQFVNSFTCGLSRNDLEGFE